MEIPNLKIANSQLYNYKTPFKGETDNTVSNQINSEIKPEIVSRQYADATKSAAMAQILTDSDIKPGITPVEYVNSLIKKGKIQDKDFCVVKGESDSIGKDTTTVIELNKKGQKIKDVIFWSDVQGGGLGVRLYSPSTQKIYKALELNNGKLEVLYNDTKGEPVLDEVYKGDGKLERNAIYQKCEKGETSINGDYKITGIELPPVD